MQEREQVKEFARAVLSSPDLEVKLAPAPSDLADDEREVEAVPNWPGRSERLKIVPIRKAKVPSFEGWGDPRQRRRIVHALANHELQATELFAWALLKFPHAPPALRRGLLKILGDEQRHTRMYMARLEAMGRRFGDYPVSGYFWRKARELATPAHFLCAMSLTFENANLDHTLDTATLARQAGDTRTAAIIDRIHEDELEHVRFGWYWLRRLKKPEMSMWEAYRAHLSPPLHPGRASGRRFHRLSRKSAGMDKEFIDALQRYHALTDAGGQLKG